jgi:hypothetical protein
VDPHSSGVVVVRVISDDGSKEYVIMDGSEGGVPPIRSEVVSGDGLRALWAAIGLDGDELADAVSTADRGWDLEA